MAVSPVCEKGREIMQLHDFLDSQARDCLDAPFVVQGDRELCPAARRAIVRYRRPSLRVQQSMKVIQVGIGGMSNTWLSAGLNSPRVMFVGFVEVNDDVAKAQVERYGLDPALIFPSLKEALTKVSAEGVVDITPPQFHRAVSMTALEAGIPVLSEKPLANTLEAARDIVHKAQETGVLHIVAQNYRYSIPAQRLMRVLDSGQMGRVASVSVEFFKRPRFGGFREEMPYPLIIDMAIHHFDMMRMLLDNDAISMNISH
jgi:predicted dehydrogenase